MTIFSLDNLTLREIKALRKSLDYIPITGIDAMFIATLQLKMNEQLKEIEDHLQQEQNSKNEALKEAIEQDSESTSKRGRPPKSN